MPSQARAAIKASFLKLLNQRPLREITVKDIVQDCGVNRNSFYYHFQDIPASAIRWCRRKPFPVQSAEAGSDRPLK